MSRFTTDFQPVPASEVRVGNLRAGAIVTRAVPLDVLSSLAGLFSISADTARLINDLLPAEMPRRLAA